MIWRAIALTATLLTAVGAQAQTIVTRSGEHDGFTRLVMRLPGNADWSLTQSGKTATVNIDAPEAVFDTSRVFRMIPRTRLQSLGQIGPGQPLRLQLGCDCKVTSYVQQNGYLVVDIRDLDTPVPRGATVATSSAPLGGGVLPLTSPGSGYRFRFSGGAATDARMALELATAASQPASTRVTPQAATEQTSQSPAPVAAPPEARIEDLGDVMLAQGRDSQPIQTPKPVEPEADPQVAASRMPDAGFLLDMVETERAAVVNESEQRLLQQIGRAARQGLLKVGADGLPEAAIAGLDPLGRSDRPLNPLDHIAVTSAIDRETGLKAGLDGAANQQMHCLPDRAVAIQTWGDDSPFADQVSALRSALVREFDDVNPASVYALSRIYLYFGFGAESRSMLEILPEQDRDHPDAALLTAMASLLDGESLPVNHPFSGQQGCEGDTALWGALADGEIKRNASSDAIQLAFSKLPVHLRVHLGPRVSKMFAKTGDHHVAEAILRAVDRTGVEDVPEINLAEAAIAELEGDTEKVAEELTSEVAERTGSAPTALIELVALSVKERKALSPDVPDLVASYELENRDTELGADLRLAQVSSLALMGQFHDAFEELDDLTERDGPAARVAAIEPLMLLLTERADDVTFLQYALVFSGQATAGEAAPVAADVARRLLDLGFAEQAQTMLNKLSLEPEDERRRLMMAEAALELGKPHRALVELMGLEGTEANRLRAEALWRNGEYGRAGEYLLAEDDANAAARGFWHSENLDAIEAINTDEEPQFKAVATVTTQISETARDPEGLSPLAHARALVESSEGTRGGITDLLRRVGSAQGAAKVN
ncbi:hypothetical protein KUV61_06845 [Nocardioides marinus]|nr:hypothetical protein [Nocardioides marinus]